MSHANEQKSTTPQTNEEQKVSTPIPSVCEPTSCPPPPQPRKRKTVSVVRNNISSLPAPAAIVTPPVPTKRRRLDVLLSPSPIPTTTDSAATTPSYQALYGDDEDRFRSIIVPNLHHTRPGTYKRRNSVTKFSLQAAHHMTLLEAAKKTLEKLRQESLQSDEGSPQRQTLRSLFRQS